MANTPPNSAQDQTQSSGDIIRFFQDAVKYLSQKPANNTVSEPPKEDKEKRQSRSYFLHKVGTQILAGFTKAASIGHRAEGHYRYYYSQYRVNPGAEIFQDPMTPIYQSGNPASSALSGILPKDVRGTDNLTAKQLTKLGKDDANYMYGIEKGLGMVSNGIEIAANLASLYLCLADKEDADPQHIVTYASRSLSAGAYFVAIYNQGKGSMLTNLYRASQEAKAVTMALAEAQTAAYNTLRFARWSFMVMNITQAIGGFAKLGIEISNALDPSKKANPSAAIEGTIQAGLGTSWIFLNRFFLKESAALAAKNELAGAIDVLRAQNRVIEPFTKWGARITGIAGAAWSAYRSGSDIYNGIFGDNLSAEEKEHDLVSGGLGMASALSFAAYAFLITPAALPVGTICFASSLAFMGAQTIYDEWDNGLEYIYDEMVNEMVGVYADAEEYMFRPIGSTALKTASATTEIHGEAVNEMVGIYADAEEYMFRPIGSAALKTASATTEIHGEAVNEMVGVYADAEEYMFRPAKKTVINTTYRIAGLHTHIVNEMAGLFATILP